jgi:hypothetical protein
MSRDIDIHVRVRPLLSKSATSTVTVSTNGDVVADGKQFSYPSSVITGSDQSVAFDAVATRLLRRLHDGYSVTLMAYGQTGSGKTFTMFGPSGSLSETALLEAGDNNVPEKWGIFPRFVMNLIRTPNLGSMYASAVEVYSSQAYDLLSNRSPLKIGQGRSKTAFKAGTRRSIHNNSGGTGYPGKDRYKQQQAEKEAFKRKLEERRAAAKSGKSISSLKSSSSKSWNEKDNTFATVGEALVELKTDSDVAKLARQVEASRVAHGHALNERSSRSHCLVTIHVVTNENGILKKRNILFVDLAGSERITKSKVEGTRQTEAVGINQSLTVLGRVVKALGTKKNNEHIPYRDSTLTMLLKNSFGGKSCTSVVINVASESQHAEETVCSLRYGGRMTRVQNNSTVVAGQNANSVMEKASYELKLAKMELMRMEEDGNGPRFDNSADPSSVRSMKRNLLLSETLNKKLEAKQHQLIEAKAKNSSNIQNLANIVEDLKFQIENNRMIILRQKNIKNFYREPKGCWKSKKAEIKKLETQLQMLGSSSNSSSSSRDGGERRRKSRK